MLIGTKPKTPLLANTKAEFPFLLADIGSADPAVFSHFRDVTDEDVTIAGSLGLVRKYPADLNDMRKETVPVRSKRNAARSFSVDMHMIVRLPEC